MILRNTKIHFLLILFCSLGFLSYTQISLLKDVNTGVMSNLPSSPNSFVQVNGKVVFVAQDDVAGNELWVTDGTSVGTKLLMDIIIGEGSSNPQSLVEMDGYVYFVAYTYDDESSSNKLWRTDGTEEGTSLVYDGIVSVNNNLNVVRSGNNIYFISGNSATGSELWKSDGTISGTSLVKDINPGVSGSGIFQMTDVSGTLFFAANNGATGYELWKSDGTTSGTSLVKDINPGTEQSLASANKMCSFQGQLYFTADNGTTGYELWVSDGTSAGTVMISDISAGSGSSTPKEFMEYTGSLYFTADNGVHGFELWKTDGTIAGTTMVKDINSGGNSNIKYMTLYNGGLYFAAISNPNVTSLWKTDGTTAGTVIVKTVVAGGNGSTPTDLYSWNGILYFQAQTNTFDGRELWKSDGTAAGTVLLKEMSPGGGGGVPKCFTGLNGFVLFQAVNSGSNVELWITNGTAVGTFMLKDIRKGMNSNRITEAVNLNNKLYFSAYEGVNGQELWSTDGTNPGTYLFKNISIYSSGPNNFCKSESTIYFSANNETHGYELWKSDGTVAGTLMVKDLYIGSGDSNPKNFIELDGKILFTGSNGSSFRLCKTDGTAAGTIVLKGNVTSFRDEIVEFNGEVYFVLLSGAQYELWKTNGTSAGTVFVANAATYEPNLTVCNNYLFFTKGDELWRTDGTTAGTILVKDFNVGTQSSEPRNLTVINGVLYFSADDNVNGKELWRSDGTTAGTYIVLDINIGVKGSYPSNLCAINDQLFFSANDGMNGDELWKSDGTAVGTYIVKDIFSGSPSSNPNNLFTSHGFLYFSANEGINGHELWRSNGTSCGTFLVQNVNSGNNSSFPMIIGEIDNNLILNLYEENIGRELFKYQDNSILIAETCGVPYTWNLNNHVYNQSGIYFDTLTSISGCDSIAVLDLTIHSISDTVVATACDSFSWPVSGQTYTSSGFYNYTVVNSTTNCSAVMTLDLTIQSSYHDTITIVNCNDYFWSETNINYSSSGLYSHILMNQTGCDSIITLNLTILNNDSIFQNQTACLSYTWTENNTTYTQSGIYFSNHIGSNGCDSVIVLNLIIANPINVVDNQIACSSYTWIDGNTYTSSTNTPTFVLQNATGCDSTVTLHLTIENSTTGTDIQTSCDSYDWIDGNTYTSSTNTPIFVLQNASGCDSVVTLNLTITHSTTGTDVQTACDSYDWIDGNTYTSSTNTPTFVLQNALGCDSIVTLNLTITNSNTGIDVQTACDSFDWIDGNTYTSSTNIPTFVLQNALGCDSIVTLNLTITNSNTGIDVQTTCDSLIWIDGITYTSSTNTPTFILQNEAGCDSIITLNLTIIPALSLIVENIFVFPSDANSCTGEVAVTVSGNAPFELDLGNGSQIVTSTGYSLVTNLCPGTHDLHVTDNCGDTLSTTIVIPVDSNYVFNNPFIDSLAQDSLGVTLTNCDIYYAGIDTAYIDSIWANGNTVNVVWNIVDSNGSNFDTTSYVLNNGNGVYWLQLSVFCPNKSLGEYFTVTEAIYFNNGSVSTAGLVDIGTNLFAIYPNPTNDQVHISFSGSDAELIVYDVQGKVVLKDHIQTNGIVSLQNFERGVYLFDFNNSQGRSVQRVVKQ